MSGMYRISEQDYVNAIKLFGRFTQKHLAMYALAGLVLVMLALFGSQVIRGGAIGAMIGALIVIVPGHYILTPLLARYHYRKYKAMHEEFSTEIVAEGIHFVSPDMDGTLKWDKILKWREDEHYILVYPMPRLFHIIPKSIVSQGVDIPALIEELHRHVGKPV